MRPDLITRLKAFGATDAGIKAIAELGLSDAAIEDRLRAEDAKGSAPKVRYKVIEETTPMAKGRLTVHFPEYAEKGYKLFDVFDQIAIHAGEHAAEAYAGQLLGKAATDHPKLAEKALGVGSAVGLRVAYKAMASSSDQVDQLGMRFLAALRAQEGDAGAMDWLTQALADMSEPGGDAASGADVPAGSGAAAGSASSKVTDSGPLSAQTTKAQPADMYAAGMQGAHFADRRPR